MLLIDGAQYELWAPPSEDEFEKMFADHASEIFGEDSKYFDLKHKLVSKAGTGSIPDGYVVTFGDKPAVRIIELELTSHSLQHIVSQIINIISGVGDAATQQKICNRIEDEISQDEILTAKMMKAIRPKSIHRFLADYFSNAHPIVNIVIDENLPSLGEAIDRINYPHRIVEFRTFTRVGAEPVHAHLFEPLVQARKSNTTKTEPQVESTISRIPTMRFTDRVTIKDLLDAHILKVGQIIHRRYNDQRYEGRVLNDGGIELTHIGKKLPSINAAAKSIAGSVDAWTWWRTTRADGTECLLDELRKEYKRNLSKLSLAGRES